MSELQSKQSLNFNEHYINWIYAAFQSKRKSQKYLLFLILILELSFFAYLLEDNWNFLGMRISRDVFFFHLPIVLNILVIAFFGASSAMNAHFKELQRLVGHDFKIHQIDCHANIIDFWNAARPVRIWNPENMVEYPIYEKGSRERLGWFVLISLLISYGLIIKQIVSVVWLPGGLEISLLLVGLVSGFEAIICGGAIWGNRELGPNYDRAKKDPLSESKG